MSARYKLTTAAVLAVLVVAMVLQNTVPVKARLLFFPVEMPLALLLFLAWALGLAAGLAVAWWYLRRS